MRYIYLLVVACIIFFSAWLGYQLGQSGINSLTLKPSSPISEFFTSQTNMINGRILKRDGGNLTVKNDKNITGTVVLSKNVVISKFNSKTFQSSPSSDLNTIEFDKQVSLTLKPVNGQMQVISINYLPPLPTLPTNIGTQSGIKR